MIAHDCPMVARQQLHRGQMSISRISKRTVDEAQPQPKRYLVMDSEVKGFAVKVMPSGTKVFILQYRMGGARTPTRRYTIGRVGNPWTAETARREALRLRGLVAAGIDIGAEKQAQKAGHETAASDAVAHIFEQFKARHLSMRRSGKEVADILEREVINRWGERPVSEIRRVDVIELLDGIADRGAVYMRNRVAAHIRKMWNWAIDRGIETANPAARIGMLNEESRTRVLSTDEIGLFWSGCGKLGLPFGPLFKLLLVTGQRRDEVATIERSEVDVAAMIWLIPAAKAKTNTEHLVPLSPLALSLLEELPEVGKCFFTTTGVTPVSGFFSSEEPARRADDEIGRGDP